MLTRDQLFTFFLANRRLKNCKKPALVKPLMQEYFANPYIIRMPAKIKALLHAASFAALRDVDNILKANPGLLLYRQNVVDLAGNNIINVTAYEFALGAGDHKMVRLMELYFKDMIGGEQERAKQYAAYEKAINEMSPATFDFTNLLQALLTVPYQAVSNAVRLIVDDKCRLQIELENFRKHFSPRTIQKGEIHFSYADLEKAFILYINKYHTLGKIDGGALDRRNLFWRQIIGYIQRGFPAVTRCIIPHGPHRVNDSIDTRISLNELNDYKLFPLVPGNGSPVGLGYTHAWYLSWEGMKQDAQEWLAVLAKLRNMKKSAEKNALSRHEKTRCSIF